MKKKQNQISTGLFEVFRDFNMQPFCFTIWKHVLSHGPRPVAFLVKLNGTPCRNFISFKEEATHLQNLMNKMCHPFAQDRVLRRRKSSFCWIKCWRVIYPGDTIKNVVKTDNNLPGLSTHLKLSSKWTFPFNTMLWQRKGIICHCCSDASFSWAFYQRVAINNSHPFLNSLAPRFLSACLHS